MGRYCNPQVKKALSCQDGNTLPFELSNGVAIVLYRTKEEKFRLQAKNGIFSRINLNHWLYSCGRNSIRV